MYDQQNQISGIFLLWSAKAKQEKKYNDLH